MPPKNYHKHIVDQRLPPAVVSLEKAGVKSIHSIQQGRNPLLEAYWSLLSHFGTMEAVFLCYYSQVGLQRGGFLESLIEKSQDSCSVTVGPRPYYLFVGPRPYYLLYKGRMYYTDCDIE